jgi:hypothetical protein
MRSTTCIHERGITMSYKLTLIDLCNKVTADLMFKYETVQNKCGTGAAMLQEMARAQGIDVKVQGGLWDKNIEHNWCVDPVTNDIYDPTASQFINGVNGLQSKESKQSYLAISKEDEQIILEHARIIGWNDNWNGISRYSMGLSRREKNLKLLEQVKQHLPGMQYLVSEKRVKSELRTAKNGNVYGVIRPYSGLQLYFDFDEMSITQFKNGVIVTEEQDRSYIIFAKESTYTIAPVVQRAFVSTSGKVGILTRIAKKDAIKIKKNKAGGYYQTSYWKNEDNTVSFGTVKAESHIVEDVINEFEELLNKQVKQ